MTHVSPFALACTSGHLGSVDHALLQLTADHVREPPVRGRLGRSRAAHHERGGRDYGAQLAAMSADTVEQAGPEPSGVPLGEPPAWLDQG